MFRCGYQNAEIKDVSVFFEVFLAVEYFIAAIVGGRCWNFYITVEALHLGTWDKVKYLNYLAGVADRYQKEKKDCPRLRMVVIYTGDIRRSRVSSIYDKGAVKIHTETAFLSELDGEGRRKSLEEKVRRDEALTDEELMKFIILPLSYQKKEEKEKRIQDAVVLAVKIRNKDQQVFTDKIIDRETAVGSRLFHE